MAPTRMYQNSKLRPRQTRIMTTNHARKDLTVLAITTMNNPNTIGNELF